MKTLTQHIHEKLRIGKDWVPEPTVGIFDGAEELFIIQFDKQTGKYVKDENLWFNVYKLNNYNVQEKDNQIIFHIDKCESIFNDWSLTDVSAIYDENNDIAYYENNFCIIIFISGNDKEKLKLLYNCLKKLNGWNGLEISPERIISQFNIFDEHNFLTGDIHDLYKISHNKKGNEYHNMKKYLKTII